MALGNRAWLNEDVGVGPFHEFIKALWRQQTNFHDFLCDPSGKKIERQWDMQGEVLKRCKVRDIKFPFRSFLREKVSSEK